MSVGVQNSAPVRMSAGEHLCSAGHNPEHHKGTLGWGGLGTLVGAVLGVTTGRAHCLAHRVRKRCGKKKGESRSTLIARAAGGRHSLTTSAGWWEEAMYAGGTRTSACDTSPKVLRALNRAYSKQGQFVYRWI